MIQPKHTKAKQLVKDAMTTPDPGFDPPPNWDSLDCFAVADYARSLQKTVDTHEQRMVDLIEAWRLIPQSNDPVEINRWVIMQLFPTVLMISERIGQPIKRPPKPTTYVVRVYSDSLGAEETLFVEASKPSEAVEKALHRDGSYSTWYASWVIDVEDLEKALNLYRHQEAQNGSSSQS